MAQFYAIGVTGCVTLSLSVSGQPFFACNDRIDGVAILQVTSPNTSLQVTVGGGGSVSNQGGVLILFNPSNLILTQLQ
jgi:hypothetical protein